MHDFVIFVRHFFAKLYFVRGVLLSLVLIMLAFAIVTAQVDDIPLTDAIYLVFITALTVGYGDITPSSGVTQTIGVLCGLVGVIFVGLLVAVSVRALELAVEEKRRLQVAEREADTES